MTVSAIIAKINSGRPAVDQNGRLVPELQLALDELVRQLNTNVDQTNTDILAASGGGDLKTFGVSASFAWWSDAAGVAPAGDPTRDLVVVFYEDGAQIATKTIRGTLTSAAGTIAATVQAFTGESTTVSTVNDGTDSVRVDVTHTASGAIASASFTYIDQSTSGGAPASGGGK